MINLIIGIITGVCIGYLIYKTRITYDRKNHCLILSENLDEESVQSLIEFINECIRKERLENIKGNKK